MRPAIVALALLAASAPAAAQDSGSGPVRGLFGPVPASDDQSFDLQVSLFGAYDDNVAADAAGSGGAGQALQLPGYYSGASARLEYARRSDAFSLTAAAHSTARYQEGWAQPWTGTHAATFGLSARRGRVSLSVAQQASYTPYQVIDLLPIAPGLEAGTPTAFDWQIGFEDRLGYTTRASIGRDVGRRSGLSFSYDYSGTRASDDRFNLESHGVGGGWATRVGRWAGVNLGYRLRLADFHGGAAASTRRIHDIDAGMTYARPLSFSRRTSVSFSSGAAVMEDGAYRRYSAIGNASLSHALGRSWALQGAYRRDAGFVDTFDEPLFTDGVTVSIGGAVTRRLHLGAGGGFSNGTVGQDAAQRIEIWSGSARAQIALTRLLSAGVEYVYFQYDFAEAIRLPAGASHRAERQGLRVGLTLWAPVLGSRRSR